MIGVKFSLFCTVFTCSIKIYPFRRKTIHLFRLYGRFRYSHDRLHLRTFLSAITLTISASISIYTY
nr:MAG TPA: hypothetical protein [Caudoviricetes sp.]